MKVNKITPSFYFTFLNIFPIVKSMGILKSTGLLLGSLIFNTAPYEIKEGQVYYKTWNEAYGSQSTLVKEADANTFENLKFYFGKDENFVFYKGRKLPEAHSASFEVISDVFSKDNRASYYETTKLSSRPQHFTALTEYGFSKDDKTVFWREEKVGDIGRNEQVSLIDSKENNDYIQIGQKVYFQYTYFGDNSNNDLMIVNDSHSKINGKVYYMSGLFNEIIEIPADFDTFVKVNSVIARDQYTCWRGDEKISCKNFDK